MSQTGVFLLDGALVIRSFIALTFLCANTPSELCFTSYHNVPANYRQAGCFAARVTSVERPERCVGKRGPRDSASGRPEGLPRVSTSKQPQGAWCSGEPDHDVTAGLGSAVTALPARADVMALPSEAEMPRWQLRDQRPDDGQLGLQRTYGQLAGGCGGRTGRSKKAPA